MQYIFSILYHCVRDTQVLSPKALEWADPKGLSITRVANRPTAMVDSRWRLSEASRAGEVLARSPSCRFFSSCRFFR